MLYCEIKTATFSTPVELRMTWISHLLLGT
jgi:hypothetical protein